MYCCLLDKHELIKIPNLTLVINFLVYFHEYYSYGSWLITILLDHQMIY
jgi:hypothetical protein